MNDLWDSLQYAKTSNLQAAVAHDLIKDLAIKPNEDVLDVGCGLGNLTMNIASIAKEGHVLGIDASPSMIERAKENLQLRRLSNISFKVMSASDPQLDGQFDVAFSNSVFHWIKEQEEAFCSIRRCLKAGGRIGFQFPLLDTSHPLVVLVQEAIRSLQLGRKYAAWVFPWFIPESVEAYADLLRKVSFKKVNVRQVETSHTFETVSTAYSFFDSVGLELYLQPLSPEEGTLLKGEFLKLLTSRVTEHGVRLNFRRLYVYATS